MKISIITPTYNRGCMLPRALNSVVSQDAPFEHIVVDGGSTDSTFAVLSCYPHLKVISEKDVGMYDALNKGLSLASGQIIGFLNSDDSYEPGIFCDVARVFTKNLDVDAVVGGADFYDLRCNNKIKSLPAVTNADFSSRAFGGVPTINAWFFRRRVFDFVGVFDVDFSIAADRDFLIRCLFQGIEILSVNKVFYRYGYHEHSMTISNNMKNQEKYLYEHLRLADKYSNFAVAIKFQSRLKIWRDATLFDLCFLYLWRGSVCEAFKVFSQQVKKEPAWVLVFLKKLIFRLAGNLARRFHAYSSS